jgi:hypothetical protein
MMAILTGVRWNLSVVLIKQSRFTFGMITLSKGAGGGKRGEDGVEEKEG